MKTYFLQSLGCKVNAYECYSISADLEAKGLTKVDTPEKADFIVLNTCSVTSTADQKSRQHIASLRRKSPKAVIAVMGCYSQSHGQQAISLGANIVLGTYKRGDIIRLLGDFEKNRQPIIDLVANTRKGAYEEVGGGYFSENTRAYLKIQDGCDNFCSYCAIPLLRGNSRSRDKDAVLSQAKYLSENRGEIVITGIDIGAYGLDLGDGSYRLADLLKDILKQCPSLLRLRLSSIETSQIDDKFLALLKDEPRIANHLHIPLQSGSASVLKRMSRKYEPSFFLNTLNKIREIRPDIAITTDLIAGFPKESEQEWQESLSTCKAAKFAEIHCFPYSRRENTAAARLPDLDPKIKKVRVKEALELSKTMRLEYEKEFYGKEVEVLFESYKDGVAYGHTSNYLLVGIDYNCNLKGSILPIIYSSDTAAD